MVQLHCKCLVIIICCCSVPLDLNLETEEILRLNYKQSTDCIDFGWLVTARWRAVIEISDPDRSDEHLAFPFRQPPSTNLTRTQYSSSYSSSMSAVELPCIRGHVRPNCASTFIALLLNNINYGKLVKCSSPKTDQFCFSLKLYFFN